MEQYEKKTGGQMLAIPHNGNLSNGRMFELVDFGGNPLSKDYAEKRARYEVLQDRPDEGEQRDAPGDFAERRVRGRHGRGGLGVRQPARGSEKGIVLSHNALVAGPGNKGSEPETRLEADTIGRIAGTFTLTPVAAPWPSIVSRWFSSPGPPVTPVTPFYRSYDP